MLYAVNCSDIQSSDRPRPRTKISLGVSRDFVLHDKDGKASGAQQGGRPVPRPVRKCALVAQDALMARKLQQSPGQLVNQAFEVQGDGCDLLGNVISEERDAASSSADDSPMTHDIVQAAKRIKQDKVGGAGKELMTLLPCSRDLASSTGGGSSINSADAQFQKPPIGHQSEQVMTSSSRDEPPYDADPFDPERADEATPSEDDDDAVFARANAKILETKLKRSKSKESGSRGHRWRRGLLYQRVCCLPVSCVAALN